MDCGIDVNRFRLAALALLVVGVVACGDEEGGTGRPEAPVRLDPAHARAVDRDPYQLTCGDLAAQKTGQDAARLVIRAEFELAEAPELRRRVAELTRNRTGRSVYYALTEICKGRPASFRPARLAVQAVREGRYIAARNRPG